MRARGAIVATWIISLLLRPGSGAALPPPIEAPVNPLDFGYLELGSSKMLFLMLQNTSGADETFASITSSDAAFVIDDGDCRTNGLYKTLSASSICTLKITFTPSAAGLIEAELRATFVISSIDLVVGLRGFGTGLPAEPEPEAISPADVVEEPIEPDAETGEPDALIDAVEEDRDAAYDDIGGDGTLGDAVVGEDTPDDGTLGDAVVTEDTLGDAVVTEDTLGDAVVTEDTLGEDALADGAPGEDALADGTPGEDASDDDTGPSEIDAGDELHGTDDALVELDHQADAPGLDSLDDVSAAADTTSTDTTSISGGSGGCTLGAAGDPSGAPCGGGPWRLGVYALALLLLAALRRHLRARVVAARRAASASALSVGG